MLRTSHVRHAVVAVLTLGVASLLLPSLVADAAPEAPKYRSTQPDLVTPSKMVEGWAQATSAWHAQEYEKHRLIDLSNLITISAEIERQEEAAAQRRREAAAARERQVLRQAPSPAPSGTSSAYGAGAAPGPCAGWEGTIAAYFPSSQVAKACSVMMCESGGNPTAKNSRSTASGLFQFLDSTWESTTGTPAPARAYSPSTQIAAAAKLWSSSGWGPWECA